MTRLKSVPMPAWLDDLKPWSLLTNKDITRMFGCSVSWIHNGLYEKRFPEPDKVIEGKNYWRVDTLRREIKRRLEKQGEEQ